MRRSTMRRPSSLAATAAAATGKSNAPRRRNFQYELRQPSDCGKAIDARISSLRLVRYCMPSLAKSSAIGNTRRPVDETNVTDAPSACSIGAVSVDDTARHFGLDVATQHVLPSLFMQKSIDFRHS